MDKETNKYFCQCPICDTEFEKFAPYGDTNRQNARCPECDSTERYRLLYLYLLRETDLFTRETANVLEIGPSKCTAKFLQKDRKIKYVSVDRFTHNNPKLRADATCLPFQDNIFDMVICYHVFEHLKDDKKALSEIFRVTRPHGIAFVQVPIDIQRTKTFEDPNVPVENYEDIFGQKDHVRIYGLDFVDRLQEIGFNAKRIPYIQNFSDIERIRLGLKDHYPLKLYTTNEDLYVCYKQ